MILNDKGQKDGRIVEKRGLVLPEDLSGNSQGQRGIRDEPIAHRRFEDRHGVLLLPICVKSTEEPTIRVSFDGLTDDSHPVELKTLTEGTSISRSPWQRL